MTAPVFIGRERELAKLHTFLAQAVAGHGQVVFVSGEAGTGKTALLQEFARRAQATPAAPVIAIGTCNAYTGLGDPYLPFREILALLTGDVETKLTQAQITPENAQRLRRLFVRSIQVLVEVGPDLVNVFIPGSALMGKLAKTVLEKAGWLEKLEQLAQRKQPQPQKGEFSLEQNRLFEQYTTFLCQLAQEQPLVLVLDDLQWADAASLSLLFHLGRRISGARILLMGAYRSDEVALGRQEERHPLDKVLVEFKRYFGDIELDLRQAIAVEGQQFVEALLDSQPNRLDTEFRRALFEQTEGHPLFTAELLQALQERGNLRQDELGYWVAGPELDWQTLPAAVEGVIEERIARLEDELRQMLSVASVEGEDFTAQVIARVQAVRERQVLQALSQELEKRQRLVHEQGEVQVGRQYLSRYRFVHGLFQHYLYRELGAGERRLLHGEVAAALEEFYRDQVDAITAQLAHHYVEAGEAEKAVAYLLQAGDRARRLYAHQEAIGYYQQALQQLDTLSLSGHSGADKDSTSLEPTESEAGSVARLEALKGLGIVYFGIGQMEEAQDSFRQAIAWGREMRLAPRELIRLYWWLGEVLWWLNRFDERIQVGEEGLELLGEQTESAEAALMNALIAWGYYFKDDPKKTVEYTLRNVSFLERLPYTEELGVVYQHIVIMYADMVNNLEEATRWADILERLAQQHHDLKNLADLYHHRGLLISANVGDLRGAVAHLESGLDLFTTVRDTVQAGKCLLGLGTVPLLALGDLSKAEDCLRRALAILEEVGHTQYVAGSHEVLGIVRLCQHLPKQAVKAFQQALQLEAGMANIRAQAGLGQAYLVSGNRKGAVQQFQATLARTRPDEFAYWRMPFMVALAGLEAAYDDLPRFRDACLRLQRDHPASRVARLS